MATGKIDGLNCLTVDKKMIYIKSEAKPNLQIFIHSSAKEVPDCVVGLNVPFQIGQFKIYWLPIPECKCFIS